MRRFQVLIIVGCLANAALAADRPPVASWSFDQGAAGDEVRGFLNYVDGVAGRALRSDGQTTAVVRPAAKMPRIVGAFSVEAWVALQTYPWTWWAVINQDKDHRAGYFFGVDPDGWFGLQVAADGRWHECRSNAGPPLFAPDVDVWIGRNETPLGLSEEISVVAQVAYSFDGIIDDVRISDAALGAAEASAAASRLRPAGPALLRPPVLPSGPKGPDRFGAYYTRLRYAEEWENPWRVGQAADVVVRGDLDTPGHQWLVRPAEIGKDVRAGLIPGLEGDDLVLWVRGEWMSQVRILISASEAASKGEVQ